MLNDSIVFLDGQYTYNFNSKCVQHGIYFNNYEFKSDLPSYEAKEGLGLFYENDSLWYYYNGEIENLPLPLNRLSPITMVDQKFWQSDYYFFYSFDPKCKVVNKYYYNLPPVNSYSTHFYFDTAYIWMTRPGQVMLIDLKTGQQLEFQFK